MTTNHAANILKKNSVVNSVDEKLLLTKNKVFLALAPSFASAHITHHEPRLSLRAG